MPAILFLKAHVKGYTRKDGVFVEAHETKVMPKSKKRDKNPKKAGWPFAGEQQAPKWSGSSQPSLFGGGGSAPKHYPNAITHPHPGEDGKPFKVNQPSKPTGPSTWSDPEKLALFVPGGETPHELNGIAFKRWTDHPKTEAGWAFVEGQMDDLEEPELNTKGKDAAAGVVIFEPDGRVWMVEPSNGFAGYKTTFPKGHADEGHSLQATAIKEAFEESGLQVKITGFIGDVERTQTFTRYYRAERVGGTPAACGWETQGVLLCPPGMVHGELNTAVDHKVVALAGLKTPLGDLESTDDWKQKGKALGSNPGGFFTDPEGGEWYVKTPKSIDIAKNEVLAGKLYEAAGVTVPDLKLVSRNGKVSIASGILPGLKKLPTKDPGAIEGVMDGFAVDAWLANWDVVGLVHDNLLQDARKRAVRVDVGGSLVFRAQGDPKGKAFGDKVGELESLTNGSNKQAASVFGHITHDELQAGIKRVAAVSEDTIRSLCHEYGPGDAAQRDALAAKLIARRADLLSLMG